MITRSIVGLDDKESNNLVERLKVHVTRPEFIWTHEWQVGDLVMWDNRQAMHRVRAFDDLNERRDMRRTTVAGEEMTVEQAA